MTFTSMYFFVFILLIILVYFFVPIRHRWCVLLFANCIFYIINSKWLFFVFLSEIFFVYTVARIISTLNEKSEVYISKNRNNLSNEDIKNKRIIDKIKRKNIMFFGVMIVIFVLIFLKYYNFFVHNINLITSKRGYIFPSLNLILPLGISFYSLQAVAYLIDVYHGKCEADKNFLKFMLFMSFFPQIIQGPISRHKQLAKQLCEGHEFDYQRFCFGLQLILWGCFKKLVIADRLAIPVSIVFEQSYNYNGFMIFLALVEYGIQIYADFSGGIDIARGFSQIIGINLEINFKQPYFSTSIENFWRRWHITLGAFMRDYVFYPLSLSKLFNKLGKMSRKILGIEFGKKIAPFLSMFVVYFLVGLWHGSEWKYIAYGLCNGFFIATSILLESRYRILIKKCRINDKSRSWKLFQILRTFFIITIIRVFPRSDRFLDAITLLKRLTKRFYDFSPILTGHLKEMGLNNANWIVLVIAIGVMLYCDYLHENGVNIREKIASKRLVVRWIIYYSAIISVVVFGMYGPDYDASVFIYQQF
ncbi:MBOAT family O-acyltransferase [Lachnospiraceae bacterium C1.1]|nr:MBOAT family O-acyltransferase [Lachnospiraceae bacterium C1.1]